MIEDITKLILAIVALLEILVRIFPTKRNYSIADFTYNIFKNLVPNRKSKNRCHGQP